MFFNTTVIRGCIPSEIELAHEVEITMLDGDDFRDVRLAVS